MPEPSVKRVLIIDDSAVVRETLSQLISAHPGLEVMGTAADPFIAAELLRREIPDVITLDVHMPRMDGITFLRRLMALHPIPVVVCSSLVADGSAALFDALDAGAVDIVHKPVLSTKAFLEGSAERLTRTILAASVATPRLHSPLKPFHNAEYEQQITSSASKTDRCPSSQRVVAIGASTGGTDALRHVLEALPANAPAIAVVQHMPADFTAAFAKRLNQTTKISVVEAHDGARLRSGQALIAPGDQHMLLTRVSGGFDVRLTSDPPVNQHRPSVDVTFQSVARSIGPNAVGFLMTGMGKDGAAGLSAMRSAGARTFGQSKRSCVVYGMPREAARLGAVERELDLAEFPALIMSASMERLE